MNAFLVAARADLARFGPESATSLRRALVVIWLEVGLQAVLVYRFGRLLRAGRRKPVVWPLLPLGWLLYSFAALLVRKFYGIRLSQTADIGAGFSIGHFAGVEVVNCRLGERCTVSQQTRVGREGEPQGPQIGNGVWIGAHARVSGAIQIGDGATIAPGARVTKNVPSRALVVGDPGRVALRGYSNAPILPGASPDKG